MPLKRTVIEAGMGGLRISREKLPNHSGTAADRRKATRAKEPLGFKEYAHIYSNKPLDVENLPPDARKWFTNEHWPLSVEPLGTHNLAAAENEQIAERFKNEAAEVVQANAQAAMDFTVKPATHMRVVFVDAAFVRAQEGFSE
jgi:hypothetical protein